MPRWVAILIVSLLCLNSAPGVENAPLINDADAAKYLGKSVEVRGQVASAYLGKRGDAYLFFGAPYPNQTFTAYIPAGWTFSGGPWTLKLQGQIVGITGLVELYKGKPEIKILSMDQIKQIDSRSKTK